MADVKTKATVSVVTGKPNGTLRVPETYVATDLNGNELTLIPLNADCQAIYVVETEGVKMTAEQRHVCLAAQNGTATGVGGNAEKAGVVGRMRPMATVIIRAKPLSSKTP